MIIEGLIKAKNNFPNEDSSVLEFGVFTGDSYVKLASFIHLNYPGTFLYGFDSWQGLPQETTGIWYPNRHEAGFFSANLPAGLPLRRPAARTLYLCVCCKASPVLGRFKEKFIYVSSQTLFADRLQKGAGVEHVRQHFSLLRFSKSFPVLGYRPGLAPQSDWAAEAPRAPARARCGYRHRGSRH